MSFLVTEILISHRIKINYLWQVKWYLTPEETKFLEEIRGQTSIYKVHAHRLDLIYTDIRSISKAYMNISDGKLNRFESWVRYDYR